jgi:tetratricopeptide (TPR) repeat protein
MRARPPTGATGHACCCCARRPARRWATLAAYDRLFAEHAGVPRSTQSLLAHARLLEDAGQPARARPVLQRVVAQSKGEVAAEAAYRLATILGDARDHQAAVEWYLTAAYVGNGSRWTGPALLGAGAALAALNETSDALAIYRRLLPAQKTPGGAEDRAVSGEAAYRAAEIVRVAGRHGDALDLYLTSARLTAGSAAERRALVGAVRCLVATGDRAAAEAIYQRLQASSATEPEHLAVVRQALQAPAR